MRGSGVATYCCPQPRREAARRCPWQATALRVCLPAVVLRPMPVGEVLEEVVGLTNEIRRGDGMSLADHAPLFGKVRQRFPNLGFPPSFFRLAPHRLRDFLVRGVRVVDDVPTLS